MPEPRRRRSHRSNAEETPRSEGQEQGADAGSTPPPHRTGQRNGSRRDVAEADDTGRHENGREPRHDDTHDDRGTLDDPPETSGHTDEPEYTGRDRRDDRGGTGAPAPADTDRDRREGSDRETERPIHAGAGPAATVGRSSSWGPVLSGAATAFVVFLVFSALWVAIAASGSRAVGDNLAWFQLISGVVAAATGGAAAGWLDPRGTMTGMIQGISTWGLLVLATTVAGLTTGTALLGAVGNLTLDASIEAANVTELLQPFEAELWALFAVLLGGGLIAGLAGALTGRAHTMLALDDQTQRNKTANDRDRVIDVRDPANAGSHRR